MGRCQGGSTACVSPQRGRPQRGPAGAGTPASVVRSFVRYTNRALYSPGRLVDYRRQFERVSRSPGEDPPVFAVELEILAMRAFADLNSSARLQLVRDRFIA